MIILQWKGNQQKQSHTEYVVEVMGYVREKKSIKES